MGWVNAAMLGGLAAMAVPIIVHLVYGRRARRVELGTLRFLRIALQENVRRRRLKRYVLLALRMLAAALLAAAFARPYLRASHAGGEDRLVILLIDRSASMGLRRDGQRLIDAAVRQASQVLAQCGDGTEIEVAWFDHAVHGLGDERPQGNDADQEQGNRGHNAGGASLAEQLTGLAASAVLYGETDYGAALAWARDVAAQSHRARKELYLFTDLQRSGFDRTAPSPLPADLEVHLQALGRDDPANVAVTAAAATRLVIRPGEPIVVTAALRNAGPFPREVTPVALRMTNGGPPQTFRSQVKLEAGGTADVRFELPVLAEGLWQGEVKVEVDDDLAFDNTRHLAFQVAPPLGVLLVEGAEAANAGPPRRDDAPRLAETYFLETAIRLADRGQAYAASPYTAATSRYDPAAGLRGLDDNTVSLVILSNLAEVSAPDARRLAEFVRRGGGLAVFTGDNVRPAGYQAMAAEGLLPGEVATVVRTDGMPWRLEQWELTHPVFGLFADPQYGDLRRLAFQAYTRFGRPAEGSVLARFRGGDPAVLHTRLGAGRVLWVATSCGLAWSDWPRSRLFVPMIHQMLGYLSGLTEGGPVRPVSLGGIAADRPAPVPGTYSHDGFCEVLNTDPRESESERTSAAQFASRFAFALRRTDLQSVQQDPENRSRVVSQDETDYKSALPEGPDCKSALRKGHGPLRPDEVWPWAVLTLLVVLLLESFLANRTTT